MIKAVIFDLDGVILDSMPAHVAAWRTALAEVDLNIKEEILLLNEGNLEWSQLSKYAAAVDGNLGPHTFNWLLERQREIYLEKYAEGVAFFPPVPDLIERLTRAGLDLALVTSSTRQVLSPGLTHWLDEFFNILITRDQVRNGKPHPEPYQTAFDRLGHSVDQVVVVENAPAGIESARSAGLNCVALATTLPPSELRNANQVFSDHQALSDWLEQCSPLTG